MLRPRLQQRLCLVPLLLLSVGSLHGWSQEATGDTADINVRYFQTNLVLARHDLAVAQNANRRIPNINSKLTMIRLQNQVKYATMLLEQAMTADANLHLAHIRSIANDLELAERQFKWAEEVSKKHSLGVRDDELKRLRISAQLARLALQRAKSPEVIADPMIHFQWQIDRLHSEVLSLQVELERNRSSH